VPLLPLPSSSSSITPKPVGRRRLGKVRRGNRCTRVAHGRHWEVRSWLLPLIREHRKPVRESPQIPRATWEEGLALDILQPIHVSPIAPFLVLAPSSHSQWF
jgi:hypothetical protein